MRSTSVPRKLATTLVGAFLVAPLLAQTDFASEVRPIFEASCVECHAYGRSQGRFSLESRETMLAHSTAVTPGDAAASRLLDLVRGSDPDLSMPFRGDRLSAEQIEVLERWIDEGARWPADIAFRTVADRASIRPRMPDIPSSGSSDHPIDRILDAQAKAAGIDLMPLVDDRAFLRRASLDLIGLLPERETVEAFADDASPNERDALVRSLLARRADYAAHWMSFWNDLLRNDYSGTGYIDGGRKQISRWLYRSLFENLAYDRFVTSLVNPTPETAGFAAGIAWRGEASASQIPELQYARSVTQVFLGTNVKCASCHDSFVNEWKLADTYGLAAIVAERPLELHRCDQPTGEMARARFLFPEIGELDPNAPRDERLRAFAELMTSPENGRLARNVVNRFWQRLMGHGLAEPLDDMRLDDDSQAAWRRDVLDFLAADLIDNDWNLERTLVQIATSDAYRRQTWAGGDQDETADVWFRGPSPKRLTAEQFVDVLWGLSGAGPDDVDDVFQEGDLVPRSENDGPRVRAALVRSDLLMRSLGRPNREQVVSTRPGDLVTLQALELTNGALFADHVRQAAARLVGGDSPSALVGDLFVELLTRPPRQQEREVALELLGDGRAQAIEDLLWVLLMHPDFQMIG